MLLEDLHPFHWPLEFPDIFHDGGFDAIIGNPPFMGGRKITGELGVPYREHLVAQLGRGKKGSADIVAYFFLRALELLKTDGCFGLIATNTIAQGDSREVGLEQIIDDGHSVYEGIAGLKTKPGRGRKTILDDQADLQQVRIAVQNHRQKIGLAKSELETGLGKKFSAKTLKRFLKDIAAVSNE